MAKRRSNNRRGSSIWEQLRESTEGPTVNVSIPRELADALLRSLATALEIEDGGDPEMDDGMMSDDGMGDPDEDDGMGGPDGMGAAGNLGDGGDDMDDSPGFSSGEDDMPAGDDDDEEPEEDDDDEEPEDDADDDDKKKEDYRPETALGESRKRKGSLLSSIMVKRTHRR